VRSLKIPLATALVWLEVGCGLPSPYFLAAPIPGTLATGSGASTATFTNPGSQAGSQTTLAGFEVYYKFSASTPSGNDINLGGGGTPGPGALQADGFFPMCLASDTPPISRTAPMISVSAADSTTSFAVTLTVNSIGLSSYLYTSPSTSNPVTFSIGRDTPYTTAPLTSKAFAFDGASGVNGFNEPSLDYVQSSPYDIDTQSIYVAAANQNSVYVILYALTYGFEAGTSIVQYSSATYLGYVQITSFP
jgi:hypothetical protein